MECIKRLESRPCGMLVALKASPGHHGWGYTLMRNDTTKVLFIKKSRLRLGSPEVYQAEWYTATD